jgi:hypothetical protein
MERCVAGVRMRCASLGAADTILRATFSIMWIRRGKKIWQKTNWKKKLIIPRKTAYASKNGSGFLCWQVLYCAALGE